MRKGYPKHICKHVTTHIYNITALSLIATKASKISTLARGNFSVYMKPILQVLFATQPLLGLASYTAIY
jgi:hypothetical protein